MALFPWLPRWAGTKPIWVLLKQETVSGSGISWAVCKSAPRSRQITTPAPHRSVFYRSDTLPAAQPTASERWMTSQLKQQISKRWYLLSSTTPRSQCAVCLQPMTSTQSLCWRCWASSAFQCPTVSAGCTPSKCTQPTYGLLLTLIVRVAKLMWKFPPNCLGKLALK